MRSTVFLFIAILYSAASMAQMSDFISLKKKNNITVRSYFPGSYISCVTVYGNELSGPVHAIRNDSVFIREYDIRALPNQWGTYTVDTLGSQIVALNYRDIETIVFNKPKSFSYLKNGTFLIVGGIGYAALNVINGKYLNESITGPENRKSLLIALGVAGAGFLQNKLRLRSNSATRRKIVYICMTCPAPLKPF